MSTAPLTRVFVRMNPGAEDAVSAAFERVFGLPASIYQDARTGIATASVYVADTEAGLARKRRALAGVLEELSTFGVDWGQGGVRVQRVRREDWAESWKRHFKPLNIGGRLLVKPGWSRRRGRRGQAVVVLDPGLSFGTGQHATTGFCLRQVVALRRAGERQSFLDIGTGSGILAIAAAKLGYAPIQALDVDPDAVRIARQNCVANGIAGRVRLLRQDVRRSLPRRRQKFDVICANLMADLLLEARLRILARLAPGGALVLAGILRAEFPEVRRVYEAAGVKRIAECAEKEWKSAAFSRPT
jgi:ribosomal protein L11 methyltransferase